MICFPVPHPAIKIFGLELGIESSLQKGGFSMVVSKEMNSAVGFAKMAEYGLHVCIEGRDFLRTSVVRRVMPHWLLSCYGRGGL